MSVFMSEKSVAVIIPAYNEEMTIAEVLRDFYKELPEASFFVVDNNSLDRTRRIAQRTLEELGAPGAVLFEPRQGKGNAVRRAFLEIDADIYVLVDADMTYPACQARELIAPVLEDRADMVNGNRHGFGDYERENKRFFHSFGNRLVKTIIRKAFKLDMDVMSGYKALSRRFVKSYPLLVEGFQLETDMCLFAIRTRMRISEVSIRYADRPSGSVSKLHTLHDGFKVLSCIFNLFRHCSPLLFFCTISMAFMVLSLVFGGIVTLEWLETSYITHVPLAILAVACGILCISFFMAALILDTVLYKTRVDAELYIMRAAAPKFLLRKTK